MVSPLAAICGACAANASQLIEEAERATPAAAAPHQAPWASLTDEELLGRLPDVAGAGRQVEQHLATWVRAARDRGISWARVGEALGMTRQSAWERFKSQIDAVDGAEG